MPFVANKMENGKNLNRNKFNFSFFSASRFFVSVWRTATTVVGGPVDAQKMESRRSVAAMEKCLSNSRRHCAGHGETHRILTTGAIFARKFRCRTRGHLLEKHDFVASTSTSWPLQTQLAMISRNRRQMCGVRKSH